MIVSPYETMYTRTLRLYGPAKATIDMNNRKPYRTKAQKKDAKRTAKKGSDGAFRSLARRSTHPTKQYGRMG